MVNDSVRSFPGAETKVLLFESPDSRKSAKDEGAVSSPLAKPSAVFKVSEPEETKASCRTRRSQEEKEEEEKEKEEEEGKTRFFATEVSRSGYTFPPW